MWQNETDEDLMTAQIFNMADYRKLPKKIDESKYKIHFDEIDRLDHLSLLNYLATWQQLAMVEYKTTKTGCLSELLVMVGIHLFNVLKDNAITHDLRIMCKQHLGYLEEQRKRL